MDGLISRLVVFVIAIAIVLISIRMFRFHHDSFPHKIYSYDEIYDCKSIVRLDDIGCVVCVQDDGTRLRFCAEYKLEKVEQK